MTDEKILDPSVVAALKKLDDTGDIDGLKLEEVMMCRYKLPCRRITPGTNRFFTKYGRGSILIYATEVVLILHPEDNTTLFPRKRDWVCGPKRQYKGVLPDSSIYTNAGHHILIEDGMQNIGKIREAIRENEEYYDTYPEQRGLMSWSNETGSLNDHRCSQAFGLAGRRDAQRLMKVLAAGEL